MEDSAGDFYEERPARGWDIRAKAGCHLSAVGRQVIYEQYYGDEVALAPIIYKNPHAVTVGLNYARPMVTLGRTIKPEPGTTPISTCATVTYQLGTRWQHSSTRKTSKHSIR